MGNPLRRGRDRADATYVRLNSSNSFVAFESQVKKEKLATISSASTSSETRTASQDRMDSAKLACIFSKSLPLVESKAIQELEAKKTLSSGSTLSASTSSESGTKTTWDREVAWGNSSYQVGRSNKSTPVPRAKEMPVMHHSHRDHTSLGEFRRPVPVHRIQVPLETRDDDDSDNKDLSYYSQLQRLGGMQMDERYTPSWDYGLNSDCADEGTAYSIVPRRSKNRVKPTEPDVWRLEI